ncbi:MAG: YceI family protein [Saprospiraceae bacterium]|nr:YceI family protein [Saprospiraceae bacterium]
MTNQSKYWFLTLFSVILCHIFSNGQTYVCADGHVVFKSEAPLEVIVAESRTLRGVIDSDQNSFAFSIDMQSFNGFNSPLQRVHFNENYLESDRYRTANFTGKIIEPIDYTVQGTYTVRAKGTFNIHGIRKERIIKGQLKVNEDDLSIESAFVVLLDDHDIKIPKIVNQKIAKEIKVEMQARLIIEDTK